MAKKKGTEGSTVWVSCRVSAACEGNQARVELDRPHRAGGRVLRYRCLKCNRTFTIRI